MGRLTPCGGVGATRPPAGGARRQGGSPPREHDGGGGGGGSATRPAAASGRHSNSGGWVRSTPPPVVDCACPATVTWVDCRWARRALRGGVHEPTVRPAEDLFCHFLPASTHWSLAHPIAHWISSFPCQRTQLGCQVDSPPLLLFPSSVSLSHPTMVRVRRYGTATTGLLVTMLVAAAARSTVALPSSRTVVMVKPTVVPTAKPSATAKLTPSPCAITFDCSIKKVADATCQTKTTKQVPCNTHATVLKEGTRCFLEATKSAECKTTVVEKRTCAKGCPAPTPSATPCLIAKDCSFTLTEQYDCSTSTLRVVGCPKTSLYFDAAGVPTKVCKQAVTIKRMCTREAVVEKTCKVPCLTPTPVKKVVDSGGGRAAGREPDLSGADLSRDCQEPSLLDCGGGGALVLAGMPVASTAPAHRGARWGWLYTQIYT